MECMVCSAVRLSCYYAIGLSQARSHGDLDVSTGLAILATILAICMTSTSEFTPNPSFYSGLEAAYGLFVTFLIRPSRATCLSVSSNSSVNSVRGTATKPTAGESGDSSWGIVRSCKPHRLVLEWHTVINGKRDDRSSSCVWR